MIQNKALQSFQGGTFPAGSVAGIFYLHLQENRDHSLTGELVNMYSMERYPFYEMFDAILCMDQMMNDLGYLPAVQKPHSFSDDTGKVRNKSGTKTTQSPGRNGTREKSVFQKGSGKQFRYLIRVIFRQMNSWQGEICWYETNQTPHKQYFRSTLELMHLIQSSLTMKEEKSSSKNEI